MAGSQLDAEKAYAIRRRAVDCVLISQIPDFLRMFEHREWVVNDPAGAPHALKWLAIDTAPKISYLLQFCPDQKWAHEMVLALRLITHGIGDAYMPATMEARTGNETEAVRLCRRALLRGWRNGGEQFRKLWLSGYEAKTDPFPSFTDDEFKSAIGMTWGEFRRLNSLDIEKVVDGWKLSAAPTKPKSTTKKKSLGEKYLKLREQGFTDKDIERKCGASCSSIRAAICRFKKETS